MLIVTASKDSVSLEENSIFSDIVDGVFSVATELGPFVDCTSNQVSGTKSRKSYQEQQY
jgi:hypothetical protein